MVDAGLSGRLFECRPEMAGHLLGSHRLWAASYFARPMRVFMPIGGLRREGLADYVVEVLEAF